MDAVPEVLDALAAQHAELADLLAGRPDADWRAPAPSCPGWSVADVILHLAQTDEFAVASAEDRFPAAAEQLAGRDSGPGDVDAAADEMVAREREAPPSEIHARWQQGADHLREVLRAADPHARVTWVAGRLSVRTLATTRLAETWIHTGDVAEAWGVALAPSDRLWHVARLAWRTLPYAFARAGRSTPGPVAFMLRGPNDDPWHFVPDEPAATTIRGDALELCLLAAQRRRPQETSLRGDGPDAPAVLDLVRTYA
jgi:uncharacterized protein (TIGR03084 family)